ncbi:hypothetical protein Avbf_07053 [Armadillidium vulgare]|nr:hypothetical protein Avbf_07053 [Armadillidium vulgare]
MVSQTHVKNRIDFMETYKLLEFSGSDSDNDIVHFASFEQNHSISQPRRKRLKRKERDLLRASGSIQPAPQSKCTSCGPCLGDLPKNVCCCDRLLFGRQSSFNRWEFFRSCILVIIIICLALVTGLAVNLHSRLDATQTIVAKCK